MSHRLYKNPQVWFYLDKGQAVAYDNYQQRQFKLEPAYFDRLKFWDSGGESEITPMDQELLAGNLLVKSPPNHGTKWGGDPLSLFCHDGTRHSPENMPPFSEEEAYEAFISFSNTKEEPPPRYIPSIKKTIALPSPDITALEQTSLWHSLKERMTCRTFTGESITLEQLSLVLYAGAGYIHGKEWEDIKKKGLKVFGERKSSPSTTGLQTLDAYVAVIRVKGLKDGYYYYFPETHSLGLIREGFSDQKLISLMCDQFWCKGMACGIFLVADFRRVWIKNVKTRAHLMTYVESGHISQTFLLIAAALKLQTWLTGSFRDKDLFECLGLTEEYTVPIFFNGFGHGNASGVPEKILDFLNKS
jgi:SagB-type dehydrogenase family enzyme